MAIHTVPIEWHDLIEDPNDLPCTNDIIVTMKHWVGDICTNQMVYYDKASQKWKWYYNNMKDTEIIGEEGPLKPWRVIAWARAIKPYHPEEGVKV